MLRASIELFRSDPAVANVFLFRENKLAQYSSGLIARARGKWAKSQADMATKVTFDPTRFDKWYQNISLYEAEFSPGSTAGLPIFHIEHKQISQPDVITTLLGFLGAKPAPPGDAPPERKTNHVLERFTNPEAAAVLLERIGKPEWASE